MSCTCSCSSRRGATRGGESRARAWELFHLTASTMPTNKEFIGLVSEYIHNCAQSDPDGEARRMAARTWASLKRSAKAGPRRTLPTLDEIDALIGGRKLRTIVFFLDETFEDLEYDATTTVSEAVEAVAGVIRLTNFTTFTLFECRRASRPDKAPQEAAMDEHLLLDDNKYVADVLADLKGGRAAKEGASSARGG